MTSSDFIFYIYFLSFLGCFFLLVCLFFLPPPIFALPSLKSRSQQCGQSNAGLWADASILHPPPSSSPALQNKHQPRPEVFVLPNNKKKRKKKERKMKIIINNNNKHSGQPGGSPEEGSVLSLSLLRPSRCCSSLKTDLSLSLSLGL